MKHGTDVSYTRGCRCDPCRTAHRQYTRKAQVARLARRVDIDGQLVAIHLDEGMHGTLNAYQTHGCRCDECRKASRDYARKHRSRTAA